MTIVVANTAASTLRTMSGSTVLVATDSDRLRREVEAALGGDHQILWIRTGSEVLNAVMANRPAAVVLDLQIGNMGGMAVCLDLRLEQRARRIGTQRVVMLLDREADVFLGRRSEADAWLVKPIDPLNLLRTVNTVVADQLT